VLVVVRRVVSGPEAVIRQSVVAPAAATADERVTAS